MHFFRTPALAADFIWRDEVPSTNDALRELVAEHPDQINRTVLATNNQTAGRGRLGRQWIAPAGSALAVSILLRKHPQNISASWLPLIAGSAVRRALTRVLAADEARGHTPGITLGVKWPNDVLATDASGTTRKLSGILSEMLPDGSVIVGIGINTALAEADLPTETATSLAILNPGHPVPDPDTVLAAVLEELFLLLDAIARGDEQQVKDIVAEDSSTLGTQVRALLPNGEVIEGQATRLAPDGSLVIWPNSERSDTEAHEVVVAAGDIQHLR